MTTHQFEQSPSSSSTWWLAAFGAIAVAGMVAAMVWVVQGQVQQAEVLRAQWNGVPHTGQSMRASKDQNTASTQAGNVAARGINNGIMAASFDRP